LFGEIGDEHTPPAHQLRVLGDGSIAADGLMLIDDVNTQLGTNFDASEVDTLGGLVFARLGRRARVGDAVPLGSGYEAEVAALDGLRVASVRLQRVKEASA
jgi:CBS domain containing-hemolysin-like protein